MSELTEDERAAAFFKHLAGFDYEADGGSWAALPASYREWFKTTVPKGWEP